jgi:hypothetical protein
MKDPKKVPDKSDHTEQEIRRERKFSLAEAVGREAAGALKGASPVPQTRQLLLEIEHVLDNRLADSEGSLRRTIMARLENNPPLLGRYFGNPEGALREFLEAALATPSALESLVRDSDSRWGRDFDEKPRFNRPGQPDQPDDPYTPGSVKAALLSLLETLD